MEAIKLENNRSEEEAEYEDEEYSEEDGDEDDEVEQLETEDDSSAAENKPGCSRVMPLPGDSDHELERSRIKLQLGLNISSPTGSDVGRGRTRGLSEDDEAFKLPSPTLEGRPLSRSPPRSRSPSPETLEKMMASLSMSARRNEVKDIVSSDIARARARQQRKYHSKRGAQRAGRPKGSKAKQDSRVTVDRSGLWE
jgi:RIO kinase 2